MLMSTLPSIAAKEESDDSIGALIREFLGCPGGEKKCFSGKIEYKGFILEGTWYMD